LYIQPLLMTSPPTAQKSKNTKTGSEMQRDKEQVAAMMREKQKAGKAAYPLFKGGEDLGLRSYGA
jgi:hypothetical protein